MDKQTVFFRQFGIDIQDPKISDSLNFFCDLAALSMVEDLIDGKTIAVNKELDQWIRRKANALDIEAYERFGITDLLQPTEI